MLRAIAAVVRRFRSDVALRCAASFAPPGLLLMFLTCAHSLRCGLHSFAASRLGSWAGFHGWSSADCIANLSPLALASLLQFRVRRVEQPRQWLKRRTSMTTITYCLVSGLERVSVVRSSKSR